MDRHLAGLGINLALGILYAWSLTKGAIEKEFGWKGDQLNDPTLSAAWSSPSR